jgi:hypothetical protein
MLGDFPDNVPFFYGPEEVIKGHPQGYALSAKTASSFAILLSESVMSIYR